MSIISGKMTEVETDNKKIIEYVKDIRIYADKALSINPKHARATYALGKWNFEIVQLSWVKKMAVKAFFGGMEDAKIEDAIMYMEKARVLDQYYVINYLDLAKAYKYDNKPAKAIEVLQKMLKLPNRTADDANYKEEGKKLLEELL
jgi:tetratricopeptide (TPR) repeat protein